MRSNAQLIRICVLSAAIAACSGATTSPQPAPSPQTPVSRQPDGMSAAETEAAYNARIAADRKKFTPGDAKFMTGMIHHHAQAIEMSRLAPSHTENASIRTLAARIINAQVGEIEAMQAWLRVRDQPVPEVDEMDGTMMVHGAEHGVLMPGMLTPEQMKELAAARGATFDRLFLTYMIAHHKGAVTMVHELFGTGNGQDDTVFKFASDVQADQTSEVTRMERMLAAMAGGK
jgi:uncharacterized protein (DUF305 family)